MGRELVDGVLKQCDAIATRPTHVNECARVAKTAGCVRGVTHASAAAGSMKLEAYGLVLALATIAAFLADTGWPP